ncbi:hypothetical protein N7492_006370 [Penicillium capsulatum]|uniref:Uncharacterized protein n=1 Tax=Penicillium capsulatum TaxID=69766 RepID=A0A9W9LLN2_9EURO|nr:hypothetical protein N7492_006370 [Penicillium capsulatum]KAJ6109018.1 hypothetical protein N7512_008855 [Penicillium capsulatum]
MQTLHRMSFTRGARTSILLSRYFRHSMARPTGLAIFIHDKPKSLATKTDGHEKDATRSPATNSNEVHSKSKVLITLELPKSSPATNRTKTKECDEYYSLKMHREGPNTESGELDPKSKSKGVKRHNEAMANRYDKR